MQQSTKLPITAEGMRAFKELILKINQGYELDHKECKRLVLAANLYDLSWIIKHGHKSAELEKALVYAYSNINLTK